MESVESVESLVRLLSWRLSIDWGGQTKPPRQIKGLDFAQFSQLWPGREHFPSFVRVFGPGGVEVMFVSQGDGNLAVHIF